jgi:hypothetical protein
MIAPAIAGWTTPLAGGENSWIHEQDSEPVQIALKFQSFYKYEHTLIGNLRPLMMVAE